MTEDGKITQTYILTPPYNSECIECRIAFKVPTHELRPSDLCSNHKDERIFELEDLVRRQAKNIELLSEQIENLRNPPLPFPPKYNYPKI